MEEFKVLDSSEMQRLISLAQQGDKQAKDKLITSNYPLIKSIVKRFKNRGCEYDDLYQLGCVGFMKAINNFNLSYSVKFSTYAVPMIAGEIKRFLRDDGSIKVSRAMKTLAMNIYKFCDEKSKSGEDEPSIEQLAQHFGVDTADIVVAMDSSKACVSLFEPTMDREDGCPNVLDTLPADDNQDVVLDHLMLKQAIKTLGEREKKVLLLRFFRGKTQSEIADILHVSQVQVSRIESKVIEKLRQEMKE